MSGWIGLQGWTNTAKLSFFDHTVRAPEPEHRERVTATSGARCSVSVTETRRDRSIDQSENQTVTVVVSERKVEVRWLGEDKKKTYPVAGTKQIVHRRQLVHQVVDRGPGQTETGQMVVLSHVNYVHGMSDRVHILLYLVP